MTTPRKGKGKVPERSTPSRAAGKRKYTVDEDEEDEVVSPSKSRKQRRNTDDTSSHPPSVEGNGQANPKTRRDRCRKGSRDRTNDNPNPIFAAMYTFTSSRPKSIGVVDLSGTPSPEKRKASFSNNRLANFAPHQGPKKLVVKNLRTTPRIDSQQYLEKVWKEQDVSLDSIFTGRKEPYSLEELYKGSENACRQGKAPELYQRLRKKMKTHLSSTIRRSMQDGANGARDVELLDAFVQAWKTWEKQLVVVRQIFYYMDQAYLLRYHEHPSVVETGRQLYRSEVFEAEAIGARILKGVVDLVDLDRRGHHSEKDSTLLKQSIDTLHDLGIYSTNFEPVFKSASIDYFASWRENESGKPDLASYATACTELLAQELKRCDLLAMDRSTRLMLAELFDSVIVEEELDLLADENAVVDLLAADKAKELEQIYILLGRKGQAERLGSSFNKFVDDEGTSIVFDEKREPDMVVNLLDFKRRLDSFHMYSFHKNETMGNGLHKSFELFINKTKKTSATWDTDNAKPGEMIAKHIDLLLRGGVKAVPKLHAQVKSDASKPEDEHDFDDEPADEDAEINHHLSNALDLFRFVHGKAVFEAFYKKDLARRLLMGRSASFDAERNMLTRLRNECGAAFTHNLESMFKDMDLAREEMMSYKQLMDDRGESHPGPDLSVNVLSAAAWPTYGDVPVNIPQNVAKSLSRFETHYNSKHSGRKLVFKHALAHCQLRARFTRAPKELVVSGFQAIALLLFNEIPPTHHLTYAHLLAGTGLSDPELKRTLQSLACAKYRVLTKHPRSREVSESDTFTFNASFVDPKMRIKINQIQLKETLAENKETHQRVAMDRHYETQAAIVRIMKSRKRISGNELVVEVIKATRSRGVLEP